MRSEINEKAAAGRNFSAPTIATRQLPRSGFVQIHLCGAPHKWMMMEVFTPCVQNCCDADVSSKVPWIGSNDGKGLGRSFQQQAIDGGLVLIGDSAKRRRQPEHQVKIRHAQELSFARRKPCRCRMRLAPRAMPIAAGIIKNPRMLTFLAALDVSPELSRSANLDCLHHAPLNPVDVTALAMRHASP